MATESAHPAPPQPAPGPTREHQWLQRLVGAWEAELAADDAPQPSGPWHERGSSIGPLWIMLEGRGETPQGHEATTVMTLGYDARRQRFVGTWIGSMMDHLWVYDGELDPAGRILTLETDGPDMNDPSRTRRYRDVIELDGENRRVLRAEVQEPDGSWRQLMDIGFRRTGDDGAR